ncbi:hypothetical protein [Pelomonas sp. Root1444]|uniref:hypothetical protein n=1 Tax=Pelomonas sp. Root1444 TaxID=1736464 RepID=UPI0007039CDE|nr:hypothetical protein [Pelomonas sp. Root1444]KQY86852.1 hypothetical protein ASD35_18950 [Pelomonas sp. Root1444]
MELKLPREGDYDMSNHQEITKLSQRGLTGYVKVVCATTSSAAVSDPVVFCSYVDDDNMSALYVNMLSP